MSEASELHMDRGLELYEDDKFVEAIAEWREAILYDSEDACLYNNIGLALSELGQQEAAIAEWREAVRLRPDFKSPHRSLARALSATGYSLDALAAVRTAVRLYPDDADLYVWLGYHLTVEAREGNDKAKCKEACAAFEKAVDLAPTNSYALHELGKLQWCLGNNREAIRTLKAATIADPNNVEAHIALWEFQGRAIWRCRGRREHFRGMVETITAINNLPESEVLNQHFEQINRIWLRIYIASSVAATIATLFLWKKWQRRK